MEFREVIDDKKQYLQLLLLADEQEDMVDLYLDRGRMFVLDDDGVKCECVVTDEDFGVIEIKNLAVEPDHQRKGYGRAMIDFIAEKFKSSHCFLRVGTGDSPLTVPFYKKCGFRHIYTIRNFFINNYDHPIFESGVQLIDMVVLQWRI